MTVRDHTGCRPAPNPPTRERGCVRTRPRTRTTEFSRARVGYRFYEPNLQRWLNRDPIGEQGGISLYQFARNDPANTVDAFGESDVNRPPIRIILPPGGPSFPIYGPPRPEPTPNQHPPKEFFDDLAGRYADQANRSAQCLLLLANKQFCIPHPGDLYLGALAGGGLVGSGIGYCCAKYHACIAIAPPSDPNVPPSPYMPPPPYVLPMPQ